MCNEDRLVEVKAQILTILKANNMVMYAEHCHWDGNYISIEVCGTNNSIRILGSEV